MRRLSLVWLVGCAPLEPELALEPLPQTLASELVAAPGHTGEGFHDATLAINGVRGGGSGQGSFDVFSLGHDVGHDDVIVLGWHGAVVRDIDGPDFAVFENPFAVGPDTVFMDPVVVEVSADALTWVAFPFAYQGGEEWSADPAHWSGFAGVTPVLLHEEENPVDPLDPEAGGDVFDLADLDPGDPDTARILEAGVRYVRLSAAALWEDPMTGLPHPAHPVSDGPDIDGVYAAEVRP